MISTFTAFFDANVFYGARLRSLVLQLAQTKLFRARWSERVHDEWIGNLISNRPDLTRDQLETTRQSMDRSVLDCLVTGYEPLMSNLSLPDPDDVHVLAAAILTRASVVVTFNLKDFPDEVLAPFRLHAKHPDEFLMDLADIAPMIFLQAVKEDWRHYGKPPLSFSDYVESLEKAGVPETAKYIRQFEVLISE